jgi:hypothetical protein
MTAGYKSRVDSKYREVYYKSWSGVNGKYDYLGKVKDNDYSMSSATTNFVDGHTTCPTPNPSYTVVDCFTSNEILSLHSRVCNAVRGHQFNAGVCVGEARKTVELAANAASRIGKSLLSLKRGNLTDAMRFLGSRVKPGHRLPKLALKDVSSAWLEARYGWEPLISDVYEAGKAWEHAHQNRPTEKVVVRMTVYKNDINLSNIYNDHTRSEVFVRRFSSRTVTLHLRPTESTPRNIGLLDPVSVAWELMPYSFIVDWFVPIGTYLDVCSYMPTIDSSVSRVTVRHICEQHITNFWKDQWIGYPFYKWSSHEDFASCHREEIIFQRAPFQLVGNVPFPSFKRLDESVSIRHLENALALLHLAVAK